MRVVAIVQARMGSSRLPGKSMMALAGRPLIDHVFERVKAVEMFDDVCIATSLSAPDDAIVTVGSRRRLKIWRGSEWDVLSRMVDAARFCSADVVVRATGDCPFFAPEVARDVINGFFSSGCDYVWNDTARSGYPDGTDVEVFTRKVLEDAHREATKQQDREHVTPWIRERANCGVVAPSGFDYNSIKLSVDRAEDYERAKAMYDVLASGRLSLVDTLAAYRTVTGGS